MQYASLRKRISSMILLPLKKTFHWDSGYWRASACFRVGWRTSNQDHLLSGNGLNNGDGVSHLLQALFHASELLGYFFPRQRRSYIWLWVGKQENLELDRGCLQVSPALGLFLCNSFLPFKKPLGIFVSPNWRMSCLMESFDVCWASKSW